MCWVSECAHFIDLINISFALVFKFELHWLGLKDLVVLMLLFVLFKEQEVFLRQSGGVLQELAIRIVFFKDVFYFVLV